MYYLVLFGAVWYYFPTSSIICKARYRGGVNKKIKWLKSDSKNILGVEPKVTRKVGPPPSPRILQKRSDSNQHWWGQLRITSDSNGHRWGARGGPIIRSEISNVIVHTCSTIAWTRATGQVFEGWYLSRRRRGFHGSRRPREPHPEGDWESLWYGVDSQQVVAGPWHTWNGPTEQKTIFLVAFLINFKPQLVKTPQIDLPVNGPIY